MIVRRTTAAAAALALVAGLTVTLVGTAGPAAAATPCAPVGPGSSLADGEADFDGDGVGDVAYGEPNYRPANDGGRVVVEQSDAGLGTLTLADADQPGVSLTEGSEFGTVALAQKVDNDSCTDLIVSAPGLFGARGGVYVFFGATTGIGTGRAALIIDSPVLSSAPRFGEALSATRMTDGSVDLVIGAPGTDVRGQQDAGAVHLFHLYDNANNHQRSWSWSQGLSSVGKAEKGDRFGEVVLIRKGSSGNEVIVGVPLEDVGSKQNAGVVDMRRTNSTAVTSLSQDSPGVPDKAESGDRFGFSLSARDGVLAVGVPFENLGSRIDTGAVQLFSQRLTSGGSRIPASYTPNRFLTRDTDAVPGNPLRGDILGISVQVGRNLVRNPGLYVAAGSPGRTVGSVRSAGAVVIFGVTKPSCPRGVPVCGFVLSQADSTVAGEAQEEARFGESLGIDVGAKINGQFNLGIVIGTPKYDVGTDFDQGVYVRWEAFGATVRYSTLITDPAPNTPGRFGATPPARWSAPSQYTA